MPKNNKSKSLFKSKKDEAKFIELLSVVHTCCAEGYNGTWDCGTLEGKEGFSPMADCLDEVAALLGLKLKPTEDFEDEPGMP